ncbi:glycoside hydrolase family 5 protein [Coprinopsis marcescibilis]|uniref:mannan endo-1,4-beta-mannosidase n=1 Tax=Coprinopsis marcescibilis TaxID=230819 RepID=A0A5C3LAX9_COPMA|nr:glycoside hydrolase family 5 protein [Coprinopsis marcescibilis]
MLLATLWPAVLGAFVALASAKQATRTTVAKRQGPEDIRFVTTENGRFTVNGGPLNFVGTNAYWLHTLNTDDDIDYTLGNISRAGIKVVRTWAFNDVTSIPEDGVWFQLLANDGIQINEGPNGLQKLDKVVELAEKHGVFLLLALTNNWNPDPLVDDINIGAGPVRRTDIKLRNNDKPPRNFLSNDYGGMDTYVRHFGLKDHEEFYTNEKVINAFKNYTATLVKRYANSPAIFGWELANDARCNSTLAASSCNPKIVTKWHSEIAQHVGANDPNHLVASGAGGQLCIECPKLFPIPPPPPPPAPSPAPGLRRRSASRGFFTKAEIIQRRAQLRKRNRLAKRKSKPSGGVRIRGRWNAAPARRQEDINELGSQLDGSFGVDSEDILNIPQIGFGSFQLFPDQNPYGADDPDLTPLENLIQKGDEWIRLHAEASDRFNKPTALNGFGVVTNDHAPDFVPFNSTEAPFASDSGGTPEVQPFGLTATERDEAYSAWLNTGASTGLTSMIQYQWGQQGLSVQPGSTVSEASGSVGVGEDDGVLGVSPNDGYSANGVGQESLLATLEEGVQNFAADTRRRR